jgi:hypothetical protein
MGTFRKKCLELVAQGPETISGKCLDFELEIRHFNACFNITCPKTFVMRFQDEFRP